jgi:glycosyltransferase involved in cell wall biosynthesis
MSAERSAEKLRVLIWYWGRKGAGPVYAQELMRALAAQPDVEVSGSIAAGSELRQATEALGLPLALVPTYHDLRSFALASLRLPWLRREFQNFLRQGQFDVVLSTMSHSWTPFVLDCIGKAGAAYVPVLHDAMPHPGESQPLWRWRRRRELAFADRVICLSQNVATGVTAATDYPQDKISIIPYGVPAISGLLPMPRVFPQQRNFRFMFFGRIMDYKGLDLALKAYAQLRQQAVPLELWLVGAGDLTPYQALLQGQTGLTIINRWIKEEEIAGFLNEADAILLPYREASQSGVTSQAYAAGLPVVATPAGGLKEQVIEGKTGFLAEQISAEALAVAMQKLLDPSHYQQIADHIPDFGRNLTFTAQGAIYAAELRRAVSARQARRTHAALNPQP